MSLIYMITNTNSSVLADGIIPLSTIARRRGCALVNGSNSIQALKPGYYKVSGTITFTAPAAGNVIVTLQKNGTAVPGISTSGTVTTATTEINTLPISGIVRVLCNEGIATFTLVNTGVAITTTNVSLDFISID